MDVMHTTFSHCDSSGPCTRLSSIYRIAELLTTFSFFFFSSRRRHTRLQGDWSSDVCSSDLCLEQLSAGSGDRKTHARVHELTMDCQEFCVLSATLVARGSDLMQYACEACADRKSVV